ncbi:transcriptional regulator [Novosphingobium piscinae]|uniref:Transcriptional regulator n=1 Tax=Novosphingobium piscinae TaxID=1507448 RepID=A0A7X1KP77_9SPHN|nr:transcriptional regulator [Novosphingobium piscinae]MBC2668203.1 transcriptional regulator [Novosphingobium piscinae]
MDAIELAEAIYRFRRRRDLLLQHRGIAQLFTDPAWDMLLDLFIARGRGKSISITSLSIAGCVPATTGLRWIELLVSNGLASRRADETDGRRTFIEISDTGYRMLEDLLSGHGHEAAGPV